MSGYRHDIFWCEVSAKALILQCVSKLCDRNVFMI